MSARIRGCAGVARGRVPAPCPSFLLKGLARFGLASLAATVGASALAQEPSSVGQGTRLSPSEAAAAATDPVSDRGFSYFLGLGRQNVRYRETASILPVRSSVHTDSPLLVTGALFAVSPELLFSLDSESTFAPGRGGETWRADTLAFNGGTLTDTLLQTNAYTLSMNKVQLLGHYRVKDEAFGSAGFALNTLSFKRFGFAQGPDRAVALPTDRTVEESSSEITLLLGAALESERVRGVGQHYTVRALLGLPVWRRVENSQSPQVTFSGTGGYDLSLEGRYSRAVVPHVHLGGWAKMGMSSRPSMTAANGLFEVPRSRMDNLSYGLELLWKL